MQFGSSPLHKDALRDLPVDCTLPALAETFRELQAELLKKATDPLPLPEMNPQVAELLKAVKKWESGKTVIFVDEKD